ncbi:hypothetical protein [Acinetobacter sp. A47]|uniref:hypothetical protein n=1 Tax=Acinetobacter sp. A47 TaxID=1561217 RepID=UPI00056F29F9|nr:hypothetical protein [Acinetobacter sp. A47]
MTNSVPKSVSITEANLINWFDGQLKSLRFNDNLDVEKLSLTFDKKTGYSILLETAPIQELPAPDEA